MSEFNCYSRRRFLHAASLGGIALSLTAPLRGVLAEAPPQNAITPQAALNRLLAGNVRYAANKFDPKDFSVGRAARARAQYPIASILGCADSRVAPELMFDQAPGDLFVVRIAGNYLNRDALSSLEYGVGVLGTPLVMVLGHSNCGAVKATIEEIRDSKPLPGHIWDITDAVRAGIENVVKSGGDNLLERAIEANTEYNAARTASAQPIISEAVKNGRAMVVAAEYELATGKVRLLKY
ncbi:MAG: carbonic anhydrase [Xanthomonadaceae bacterium]|nr:carbonic anhydrase [Xanthomonadaceae bacterium]MDE1886451.1 carbonic anhydrase [Xanthomonadaceae bacterium]MDE2084146.1 carbonic anhydrase [Xanthomonadaceae bacterium]